MILALIPFGLGIGRKEKPKVLAPAMALAPGDPAPPLEGRGLDGKFLQAAWGEHPLTVVNFWGTYCEPCRNEMPALQEALARRSKDGLAVIGVLFDTASDATVRDFLRELGVTYPVIKGDLSLLNLWGGVRYLPTSFLVNRQGKVVRRAVGATPEQIQGMIGDIDAVLDGRPLATAYDPTFEPPPARPNP